MLLILKGSQRQSKGGEEVKEKKTKILSKNHAKCFLQHGKVILLKNIFPLSQENEKI